mgnify:FL=1
MIAVAKSDDIIEKTGKRTGYELIGEKDGCVNGCRCGISVYTREEYDLAHAGAHDDQEGFFVLEGRGRAMVGGDEIVLEPGVCFVVPAGVKHCMKCEQDSEFCKVFWFHAAV